MDDDENSTGVYPAEAYHVCPSCGMPEHGSVSCESVQAQVDGEIEEWIDASRLADEGQYTQPRCGLCGAAIADVLYQLIIEGSATGVCQDCWEDSDLTECPLCGEELSVADGGLCDDCLIRENTMKLEDLEDLGLL